MTKRSPAILNAIADKVLRYRPKAKSKASRRRKRRATKIAKLYALQVPAGNIFPMGTEKPKLTKEDRRNFWKGIRIK